jgi:NAD(P)H-hydrate epimerase
MTFKTSTGISVPAVTADQMREVDRVAAEDYGLDTVQMMENAGRSLAQHVMQMIQAAHAEVVILAGAGGNGSGGICCARHLHNRGFTVQVVLDRDPKTLTGAAAHQLHTLQAAGLTPVPFSQADTLIRRAPVTVDALIGYGLHDAPSGRTADLIALCNDHAQRVLALDVPSGLDATTGSAPGAAITPARTLALALPKTGLERIPGDLYVADIGIPPEVYDRIGIRLEPFFGSAYWLQLFPA